MHSFENSNSRVDMISQYSQKLQRTGLRIVSYVVYNSTLYCIVARNILLQLKVFVDIHVFFIRN